MGSASTPLVFDVLVTGSSGHLGTALMLSLPNLGFTPLGIDILPSETATLTGDISSRPFIASIIESNPSITHILHAATLHKPHVGSHISQNFIDTNITGTLVLLEAAAKLPDLQSFIFISTTSTFGAALSPASGKPAVWINEQVCPMPKNIYGVTKCAAEDMCFLAAKNSGVPALVLRTSRFFPEEDDDEERRMSMSDENLKVLELTYRRVDIADIVSACHCAMLKAKTVRFEKFIVSAPSPFPNDEETLRLLDSDPQQVLDKICPEMSEVFAKKGWKCLDRIDRVYDSTKAIELLGWKPKYTFADTVARIGRDEEWRSELAIKVGKKGYHAVSHSVYTKR